MARSRASWTMFPTQNKCKRLGPFGKNWSFRGSWLLAILQKKSTSLMHNFLNFDSLKVFLDFLESLRCYLSNPFGIILILVFHVHAWSFDKKGVFVDFSKWPIMSKFITFVIVYFELGSWRWIVGHWILF